MSPNPYLSSLRVSNAHYDIFDLNILSADVDLDRVPISLKVLIEGYGRLTHGDLNALQPIVNAIHAKETGCEIQFMPSRVLLQDLTGVPSVVDLASMRDAIIKLGGDANAINPLTQLDLVIDHSVSIDFFGSSDALAKNVSLEYQRNQERYSFLKWGQQAFKRFTVVPPATGICHQVNLEALATVVSVMEQDSRTWLIPDTLVGMDSHTTMINGLGVLGWGVGGIEAEAMMLGQPTSIVLPQTVGFKLKGQLQEGVTATDLVLTIAQQLRKLGVVGKFVEFFGPGLSDLSLANRATIANMSPEFGSTCAFFPVDEQTLKFLELTGRPTELIDRVRTYCMYQKLWRNDSVVADYNTVCELDLSSVKPCLAGPKRPHDRIELSCVPQAVQQDIPDNDSPIDINKPSHGSVAIAAITSCTNTSNPDVMIAAGLVAKNAVERGLKVPKWVKTSLAPGSQVVAQYLHNSGLMDPLEKLGFHIAGFGCTTCIGNSGPLAQPMQHAIAKQDLQLCSVLSGNRNFEGRVHADVALNFLASPPLVVIYALAGNATLNVHTDPIQHDPNGHPVFLKDLWPDSDTIAQTIEQSLNRSIFEEKYQKMEQGDENWQSISVQGGATFDWDGASSYIQKAPYFEDMTLQAPGVKPIKKARMLLKLADSITTDHISPAGAIAKDSAAAEFLTSMGLSPEAYNSYGSRRGNHHVMMRGTFANVRLVNELAPEKVGGWTTHHPSGKVMRIFDAAQAYEAEQVPLIVVAGSEYGSGSSRDWAAKGPMLLGIRCVIAQSFERIHRSNLIGMGILPLEFMDDQNHQSLALAADARYSIEGLSVGTRHVKVLVEPDHGEKRSFHAKVRIDTQMEWTYMQHGGILPFVLRKLARN